MIGVVGEGDVADVVADQLEGGGRTVATGGAEPVLDRDPVALLAVGEAGLIDLVWAGVPAPVLLVDIGAGFPSVSAQDALPVTDRLVAGEIETRDYSLMSVSIDDDAVGPAAFDAMLVRSEPGRISEYRLDAGDTRSRFRADGVLVATPAGSQGYAHAAGGPRLALDSRAVATVPVAPFGLGAPSWVFDATGEVELSIERDEGEVSLLLDGRERYRISGRETVTVAPGPPLRTVVPPEP